MAVQVSITRAGYGHTETTGTSEEFCVATLSGTYVTGGFTYNPFSILGAPGSSPLPGSKVIYTDFQTPSGYMYAPTTNNAAKLTTVKIYSAANTELANGTAVPDASVLLRIVKTKS